MNGKIVFITLISKEKDVSILTNNVITYVYIEIIKIEETLFNILKRRFLTLLFKFTTKILPESVEF